MSRYEAAPWLGDLTDFQRRSVDHVVEQFYGPPNARRFLVADETGLGKTRVARGVIARSIEKLQDTVDRIDVVYVCANSDLARQNIRRLNVTGGAAIPFASRLTLLGEHSRWLDRKRGSGARVNLVSFTPGTSFDMGHSLGQGRERAMIAIALMELYELDGHQRRATRLLLQGTIKTHDSFSNQIESLRRDLGPDGIDPDILGKYSELLAGGLGDRYATLVQQMGRRGSVPPELHGESLALVRELRSALASASVHTLEPDLIILDEFQRFRHLLSEGNPAGRLAHDLFQYADAKVLLLSATPYKPFTFAGEDSEDHAKDLFRTLDFLSRGRDDVDVEDIRTLLQGYRASLLEGRTMGDIPERLRAGLLKIMSRAERPALPEASTAVEHVVEAADIRPAELGGFGTLVAIGKAVAHARDRRMVTAEYWKSAPYFLSFANGYRLGQRLRAAEQTSDLKDLLARSNHISGASMDRFEPLDPGNARMRVLVDDTLARGWWQLLWMPPSLPYFDPAGPFAQEPVQHITKRLVFSSWTATPSSVASILSYEAERLMADGSGHYTAYNHEARKKISRRLQYTAGSDGKPKHMAILLCHWPLPGLARATDPLPWLASKSGRRLSVDEALILARQVVESLARQGGSTAAEPVQRGADGIWRTAFGWTHSWPSATDQQIAGALSGHAPDSEDDAAADDAGDIPNGLSHHVNAARSVKGSTAPVLDEDAVQWLAKIGLYSPANIAYRCLDRLARGSQDVSEWGLFDAAAVLANGVRSLFNRPDAIQLVERVVGKRPSYWQKVLDYIAMGNMEAVLDEYLHQLFVDRASGPATDALLFEVAREAAEALALRSPTLRALDAGNLKENLRFVARFALRYGGRNQDSEDVRQPEVRRAFNSPFWPFVLASTSVGQEGIDFHWWCHAVFHWNTPPNPVDFEQREGRVDRYRGHAIRKNVAHEHGTSALAQTDAHPWDRLYALATDHQAEFGDYSPGWVYPGSSRIERHLAPFAFSADADRYERIKRDVALYRLTFGQPRQEDMLELLQRREPQADPDALRSLRIDLAP